MFYYTTGVLVSSGVVLPGTFVCFFPGTVASDNLCHPILWCNDMSSGGKCGKCLLYFSLPLDIIGYV